MQKFPKVFTIMSAILALAFGLASCKENVDDDPQKAAGSISYATTTVSKTTTDGTFTNELTNTGDGTVTYASSKTDVAEVNATTGLVTIKGAGETTITATVADSNTYTYAVKTASYTLTVTAADTTPQKTAGSISYAVTSVEKTTADGTFTNELTTTGDGTVTYASSKTDVAEVNTQTGLVTIKEAGTTTITATVTDSETYTYETKTATYTLTVTQAAGSISYATTTVSKTTADEAFTNTLTNTGDGTVTYASSKETVATVNATTGEVTIKGVGETTITATVADSDTYTYATKTASYTLKITLYIGTKAPSEAKSVGDIVFTDGSATPYSADLTLTDAQKSKAIAVIFYVGTECSNDSTSRTLGVGLAQNRGLAWCLESAAACETDITTIQCFASGDAGALTFTGDRNGSDNLSQIGEFLDENGEFLDKNDDTGTADNYPAFYFAKNYASQTGSNVSGTSYEDGWYLPTIAELFQVWKVKETVNAASSLCGGSQFFSDYYWSSSQYDDSIPQFARSLDFSNGSCNDNLKFLDYMYICAVRAFN